MSESSTSHLQSENERLRLEVKELRSRLDEAAGSLRVERQRFLAMAESLTDIFFTALPDGSWDFVNAQFYEITGRPVGSALGKGWAKALHPEDSTRVMKELQDALASGSLFESHFRFQTHQGSHRQFVARAVFLGDDTGRSARWIGTMTDVHDLLTAEDALHQVSRQKKEVLSKLVHDLRNLAAPIHNSIAVLQSPGADAAQRARAIEIIGGQVRELRALLDTF